MSVFGDSAKDDLEIEIRIFLEENTITDLLDVVKWCVESKEYDMLSELKGESNE